MRSLFVFLCLAPLALADTSHPVGMCDERRWGASDWTAASNDSLIVNQHDGDVLAIQIQGGGESSMLRRKRFPMRLPCRITYRIRWTEAPYRDAFPAIHVLFDPPALDDPWWKNPIAGAAGQGVWANELTGFVFHFSTTPGWRRAGVSSSLEQAPQGHEYSAPQGTWVALDVVLDAKSITVRADGKEVSNTEADLSKIRTFAVGFGDMTSTRVELDELHIHRGR